MPHSKMFCFDMRSRPTTRLSFRELLRSNRLALGINYVLPGVFEEKVAIIKQDNRQEKNSSYDR
jgi:hypothetical protein